MDPSTTRSFLGETRGDAEDTLFEVAAWEPAFENLVAAMRAEFLRAHIAIEQLRLENHNLRKEKGGCTGTPAQHVHTIETHIGPSGELTGVVPGHPLSAGCPPTTPSPTLLAKGSRTSLAMSGIVARPHGSDRQARITRTEHEPEPVRDGSAGTAVGASTPRLPNTPSGSGGLSAATSQADADEDKLQYVHAVGPPAEARADLRVGRSSSLLDVAPSSEGRACTRTIEDMRRVSSGTCGLSSPRLSTGTNASALSVRAVGILDGLVGRVQSRRCNGTEAPSLSVRDVWEERPTRPTLVGRSLGSQRLSQEFTLVRASVRAGDELKEDSVFQPCVLHPWRPKTWVWDTLVAMVATSDVIMVPLQVFSVTHVATRAFDLTTASFWSLDILVGFLRGRDIGGVLDMRPSTIARSYLQTRFVMDFALAAMDWVFIIASSTNELNVVGSMRVRRAFRFIRVLRVLRITKILLSVRRARRSMPLSDYTEAFRSVIKLLFTMWLVNHYVACGWYAIGDVGTEPNWIASTFDESDSIFFRYTTAYHWSLAQFTPASMEVVPTNAVERAYSVVAIFFGLVMFTSFVSHMTNAVTRIQRLKADRDVQRRDLRNYVQSHQVSFDLGKKIEAYVQTANTRMKSMRLLESDITVLRMLPENLLSKLREEVHTPAVRAHPLFEKFHCTERSAFISICNLAAAEQNVLIGEELFRCGQTATKMYFSTRGKLSYYFQGFDGYTVEEVPEGSWFSEATLWCNWTHRGRMMSSDDIAQVVTVSATELHRIVSATTSVYQIQRYAKMYCLLAADECGSKELMTDIKGETSWIALIVRFAWAPPSHALHSLWHNSREWYVNAFHAWKIHTTEALQARL